MYQLVSEAIVDKKIGVIVWPQALGPGVAAKYYSKMRIDDDTEFYDVIVLPRSGLGVLSTNNSTRQRPLSMNARMRASISSSCRR